MAHIVSIHSFRGGTGKSNLTANIATLLAAEGRCVGVIDVDIQSPGIHVLFAVDETQLQYSLNEYLWGKCAIKQAAYEVTERLSPDLIGRVFLIPSRLRAGEIARVLREGYDVGVLNDGIHRLVAELALDVLLIDTHPGLNEETLLSMALSDTLAIMLRPDQQDYQATSVAVEVARKLAVPRLVLIVNNVPPVFDLADVRAQVERTYACEVAAVLAHAPEMLALGSAGIFALRYPDHALTTALRQVALRLVP